MTIFTPEFIAEQEKMAKKAYMAEASDADVGLYRSYAAVYYPKALTEIERLKAKLAKRKKSKWHPASERPDQCPLRTTAQYAEATAPRGQKEG